MENKLKQVIKNFIPPIFLRTYGYVIKTGIVFNGPYSSWEEALRHSTGYNADIILERVKTSVLSVKEGKAAYERDSVLFNKIQYSWPLLSGLLWIASLNENKLNLIDFGGSLGSSYYQNRKFLEHLNELHWNIVEQKKFVECGRQYFENEHVRFYNNLEECLCKQDSMPDTIIFSSVIQYLENPYRLLSIVIGKKFKYIIFDRTPFLEKGDDMLTSQKVPTKIYKASYPAWFFNEDKFLSFFAGKYDVVVEFDALAGMINLDCARAFDKGFIFRRSDKYTR